YVYCVHLDIHSFPTRRSSDLCGYGSQGEGDEDKRRRLSFSSYKIRLTSFLSSTNGILPGMSCIIYFLSSSSLTKHERIQTHIERDRKSTRLNSSHSQISYAVF